jgi:hypothetical protein
MGDPYPVVGDIKDSRERSSSVVRFLVQDPSTENKPERFSLLVKKVGVDAGRGVARSAHGPHRRSFPAEVGGANHLNSKMF